MQGKALPDDEAGAASGYGDALERNQLQMAMVATAGSANGAAANEGDARHGAPHDEAGAAPVRLDAMGPFSEWKKGAPCALFWAFYSLPEELWARGLLCPAECALMLGATSKGVRAALARLRVPATDAVVGQEEAAAVAGLLEDWRTVPPNTGLQVHPTPQGDLLSTAPQANR